MEVAEGQNSDQHIPHGRSAQKREGSWNGSSQLVEVQKKVAVRSCRAWSGFGRFNKQQLRILLSFKISNIGWSAHHLVPQGITRNGGDSGTPAGARTQLKDEESLRANTQFTCQFAWYQFTSCQFTSV
eukprot:scaffold3670_cov124-Cylindrotheca_fusiformis.AAC.24